jgi:hypothetical protein
MKKFIKLGECQNGFMTGSSSDNLSIVNEVNANGSDAKAYLGFIDFTKAL